MYMKNSFYYPIYCYMNTVERSENNIWNWSLISQHSSHAYIYMWGDILTIKLVFFIYFEETLKKISIQVYIYPYFDLNNKLVL